MKTFRSLFLTTLMSLVAFSAVAQPPGVPKDHWYLQDPFIKEGIEKGHYIGMAEDIKKMSPPVEEDIVVLPEGFEPPPFPEEIEAAKKAIPVDVYEPTPEEVMAAALAAGYLPADLLETEAGTEVYRFGQTATVRCAPRLACSIDLEPGESIRGRVIGDPDRWDYEELVSGPPHEERWHIIVRPTDYEIHTNLMVTTDRRAYRIRLISVPYPEDPDEEVVDFTEAISFRYPERWVERKEPPPSQCPPPARTAAAEVPTERSPPLELEVAELEAWNEPPAMALEPLAEVPTAVEPIAPEAMPEPRLSAKTQLEELELPAPERLNFNYRIIEPRRKRHRFDWEPLAVMDDGVRTYIHLPPLSKMDITPVLSGITPTGEPFPLNAILRGNVYVVPRLIKRAELYLGVGKRRMWMRIERIDEGLP